MKNKGYANFFSCGGLGDQGSRCIMGGVQMVNGGLRRGGEGQE